MAEAPRYRTVYTDVKKAIKDGIYPAGTMIPTEFELCEKYNVSRTTIRKALSMLNDEGFIYIQQGKGTEVLNQSTTQRLGNISSITETLKNKGYDVQINSMSIQRQICPKYLLKEFELNEGEDVFLVERLVLADQKPIAYIKNYINMKYVPDIDQYSGKFTSLYNFLEYNYGIVLTDANETISAVVADFLDSNLLQISVGAPLIYSRRTTYSNGKPIDRSESKLVADRYEYRVHLSGR